MERNADRVNGDEGDARGKDEQARIAAFAEALAAEFGDRAAGIARRQLDHADEDVAEIWTRILAILDR